MDIDTGTYPTPNEYYEGSLEAFRTKLKSLKIARLGVKVGSSQTSEYAAKSCFRLYYLPDKTHLNLSFEEETQQIISSRVPESKNFKASHYGYSYLYEELLAPDKPSYQIILGNNGIVYLVSDYKDGSKSTYKHAPEDMQNKYQELLKQEKPTDNGSQSKTESSNNEQIVPEGLVGTWEYTSPSQGYQALTYDAKGNANRVDDKGNKYTGVINPVEEISPGLYHFVELKGDNFSAAFPVLGMGGAGFEAEMGFKLNGDKLTYVQWIRPMNTTFNPSNDKLSELATFTRK
ncbi:hypothetical protein [Streptococcus parauberis]|uniref:hypothetical protein n=1 Tax=Streptococcus parauberis TaxID=1348 RepID=UPI000CCE9681|nr:hypothetical protein [Streptococcus parauberis]MDT2749042.1 hypothetical protein [Streptococcus parauberis]PNY18611.1 hypothetical protein ASN86_01919 [Streptococcus parauberis]